MRHLRNAPRLNRDTNHRRALWRNLAQQLILGEELTTTETKAKMLIRVIERSISKAKEDTVHKRRQLKPTVYSDEAVRKLVTEIAPRFKDQPGGFVTCIRQGRRRGDNTMMVRLTLKKTKTTSESKAEIVS